jgi:cobalt-precorrin-5B (C1)-methyltransferase
MQYAPTGFAERGLIVEISVPRGVELAKKTLNPRLGIIGGISILGTTGIVQPYSTSSWLASVEQATDVAAASGQRHIVLATGGRGERFAMAILDLPKVAFVEMGPFTGKALRRAVKRRMRRVSLVGMVGKFAKLAQGNFQTHARESQVDPLFLAQLAETAGAWPELVAEIRAANTARHVSEMVKVANLPSFFQVLAETVAERAYEYVRGKLEVEAILFDFDGQVLGRAERV